VIQIPGKTQAADPKTMVVPKRKANAKNEEEENKFYPLSAHTSDG
jgi:hypothetical protein